MTDTAVRAVAQADRMHRGQIARLSLGQEAIRDCRNERIWNRMSGAGTADYSVSPLATSFAASLAVTTRGAIDTPKSHAVDAQDIVHA